MPRTCTACTHPQRDEIDRLLLDRAALRNIARRFSLSTASLFRHNKHIAKTLSNARQEADILRADGLMEHLNHFTAEAARLKQKAEQAKDYRTALAGVREMTRHSTHLMRSSFGHSM
jgi:3-methyladenine DNA glycosylase Tag